MEAYAIRDWQLWFEKNHKDTEVMFRWVALPTRHDGKSYRRLSRHPRAADLFTAFVLMVEVAAKMPTRGILADESGPLDAEDLSDATGFPAAIFTLAFSALTDVSQRIMWLVKVPLSEQVRTSPELVSPTLQDSTEQDRTEQHTQPAAARAGEETLPPGFVRFWSAWPKHFRKQGRKKCLAAWKKQKLEPIADTVINALQRCKASSDWHKQAGQFIPFPITWLGNTPWETDPAEMTSADDPVTPTNGEHGPRDMTPEESAAYHAENA